MQNTVMRLADYSYLVLYTDRIGSDWHRMGSFRIRIGKNRILVGYTIFVRFTIKSDPIRNFTFLFRIGSAIRNPTDWSNPCTALPLSSVKSSKLIFTFSQHSSTRLDTSQRVRYFFNLSWCIFSFISKVLIKDIYYFKAWFTLGYVSTVLCNLFLCHGVNDLHFI